MKKRVLAWIAAITLAITSVTPMLSFAADTDDNLTVSVDITKLAITSDPVPAETLKAHAVKSNYQIGNQGDTPTLYTISGYTPSYITYKLTAEKGKLFSGGSLTIVGKICDYASNENLFGVFVTDTEPDGANLADESESAIDFQNAAEDTMPASGEYTDEHKFDLTAAMKDKKEVYVTIYQMTTGSPEWIGYRSIDLVANQTADPNYTAPIEDLHIAVDITDFGALDTVTAEQLGAIEIRNNYKTTVRTREEDQSTFSVLHTKDGYMPSYIMYQLTAQQGQELNTGKLTVTGLICDYNDLDNKFGVFVSDTRLSAEDAQNLAGQAESAIAFWDATEGTMPDPGTYDDPHEFDLTDAIKGKKEVYVIIYQMTSGPPEWIGYTNIDLLATQAAEGTNNSSSDSNSSEKTPSENNSSKEPSDSQSSVPSDSVKDDKPAETGVALPIATIIIMLFAGAAVIILKKRMLDN